MEERSPVHREGLDQVGAAVWAFAEAMAEQAETARRVSDDATAEQRDIPFDGERNWLLDGVRTLRTIPNQHGLSSDISQGHIFFS